MRYCYSIIAKPPFAKPPFVNSRDAERRASRQLDRIRSGGQPNSQYDYYHYYYHYHYQYHYYDCVLYAIDYNGHN